MQVHQIMSILKELDPHAEAYVLTAPYWVEGDPEKGRLLRKRSVVQVRTMPPVTDVYIVDEEARDYLEEAKDD